ncbi:acyltransferase family protein [Desulfocapsa sulfexigens]|nr:acyltransferase [Desulfocapsa sulfexigens]
MNLQSSNYSYMPQLDSIKGLAVGMMIFYHWLPEQYRFLVFADFGLQFFFIISGFFVTRTLVHTRCDSSLFSEKIRILATFYAHRFLRICPLYYILILLTYVVGIASVRDSWPWHITYLSNYYFFFIQSWHDETSHFWFLAVLMQFYMLWPGIILFLPRNWHKQVFFGCICLTVLFRFTIPLCWPEIKMLSVLPCMYLDAFGIGSLLGYLTAEKCDLTLFYKICLWGGVLYVAFQVAKWLGFSSPVTIVAQRECMLLGIGWLLFHASQGYGGIAGMILGNRVLRYLGKISLGLFLIHNFSGILISLLKPVIDIPTNRFSVTILLLRILFTVALAMVSYRFLEKPIAQFKRYVPYPEMSKGNN